MTETILFNVNDPRISDDERRRLLQLSNDIAKRPFERPQAPTDPRLTDPRTWPSADGDL
jgi:hypothetical protein